MCHLAQAGLSDKLLPERCTGAWPVMVYKKQLKDNSRRYMEVFEATGIEVRKLQGRIMSFFNSAAGVLQTLVSALGANLASGGVINHLEGCETIIRKQMAGS